MTSPQPQPPGMAGPRIRDRLWPWLSLRSAASCVGLLLASALAWEALRVLVLNNVHTVIPGKVYRCAQPTLDSLRWLVENYRIRTVINLRGSSPPLPWYAQEVEATCALDLCQEDINFSAGRLPSSSELQRLIAVVDRTEYPVVLHCRRGCDRTGLAAACLLLLQEGVGLDEACGQLSPRYGHIALGKPARMADFFDYYRDWLRERGVEHSPAAFRNYALNEYRGGPCDCTFEKVELPAQTPRAGRPFAVRVRLRNSGSQPWRLRPTDNAGHHLICALFASNGVPAYMGRAGLLEAVVPPGQTIELTVPVEGIAQPGQYRLMLDMIDEQMGMFYQMGSEIYEARLDVRE